MTLDHRLPDGDIPAPAAQPAGFVCDCGARLPWPSKAEDGACPSCHYCGRTEQPLKPCCDKHPGDLVCEDVTACRDFLLGQLQEHGERFDAAAGRFDDAL
jgi:hypothetical protein